MSARARGFIETWHPRTETWELLYRIRHVLDEYVEQLPLTLRRIFYILVGATLTTKDRARLRAAMRDVEQGAPRESR